MPEYSVRLYLNATLPATAAQMTAREDDDVRPEHVPFMHGYRAESTSVMGDPLTPSMLTVVVQSYSALAACDDAYELYNADERANGQHERSASVGDVLYVVQTAKPREELQWWAVESVGFKPVPTPLITQYADPKGDRS